MIGRKRGAAILVHALFLFFASSPSEAASPAARPPQARRAVAPDVAAYQAAAAALLAKMGTPDSGATLPGITDPAYVRFREQATALAEVLGTEKFPVHVPDVDTICGPANKVSVAYMLDGAGDLYRQVRSEPQKMPQALAALMQQNGAKYFEQMLPIHLFLLRCTAASLPAARVFVAGLAPEEMTAVRVNGLRQVQAGITQSFAGMLDVAFAPALDVRRRIGVLQAVAADGPRMVPSLPREVRPRMRAVLDRLRLAQKGESRKLADAIAVQLESDACDVICNAGVLVPPR